MMTASLSRAQKLFLLFDESILHRVVSFVKGRQTFRSTCGHGYRKVGHVCRKMTPTELLHIKKGHKHARQKNKLHQGSIQRKRIRSLLRRLASGY